MLGDRGCGGERLWRYRPLRRQYPMPVCTEGIESGSKGLDLEGGIAVNADGRYLFGRVREASTVASSRSISTRA